MEGKALKKAEDTKPVAPGDDNQKPKEDDQGHKATEEESPKGEKQEEFGVEDGKRKKRRRKGGKASLPTRTFHRRVRLMLLQATSPQPP